MLSAAHSSAACGMIFDKKRQWLKLSSNMNSSNRKSLNNLTKNRSAEIVTVIHTSFPFFFASRKKLADPTYSKNVYSIGHRHSFVTLATSHYFSEIITLWKPLCTPIWTDFKGPIAPRSATENLEQILSQVQLDWKNNLRYQKVKILPKLANGSFCY